MWAFSLVGVSGGYSLVAIRGFLIAAASLVAEDGLQGARASLRFGALEHRLSSCGPQA